MEIIAIVLLIYFLLGACVCLLVCVNPNDPGLLGKLNRVVLGKVPAIIGSFVKRVFGQRVYNCFGSTKHYLMETNHPLVQFFYLLIAVGGFIAYETKGIMKHMPNSTIGMVHVVIANLLAGSCFFIYYKACSTGPGKLSKENVDHHMKKNKHREDNIVYHPDKKCEMCKLARPARAKHCRVCNMCVLGFDHHCIWIRQCVGEQNYKWFVSFLLMHSIFCLYLSVIGALSIYDYVVTNKLLTSQFRYGNQLINSTPLIVFQFLFINETLFIFLIFMCAIMGAALLIFVLYHFYLIGNNHTTYQRIKINDYIAQLQGEIKIKKKIIKEAGGEENLPEKIEHGAISQKREAFLKYYQQDQDELEQLKKGHPNKGFFHNLKVIFAA